MVVWNTETQCVGYSPDGIPIPSFHSALLLNGWGGGGGIFVTQNVLKSEFTAAFRHTYLNIDIFNDVDLM